MTPQHGLFEEPGNRAQYLEYTLKQGVALDDIKCALRRATSRLPNVFIAIAFGSNCWDSLQPLWRPTQLSDFVEQASAKGHLMPANQQDIFFWVHGETSSDVMPAVIQVSQAMAVIADLTLDLNGYKAPDARIITGFVDGTGNPKGDKRRTAAVVPDGQVGAGGSYVLGQKWTHKLPEFLQLSVPAQEQVMGRTKETNIEMEGAAMPPNSHVARTDIDVNDTPMKMYRRGTPYGNAGDYGLYFLAFACEQTRFERVIDSMLGKDDGVTDAMMDYSDAKTGSYWFMPSQEDLDALLMA
tara:strand:+ start:10871 stop:11761 length:891 start_codon:yes stop_codon:yes gene_type:complete